MIRTHVILDGLQDPKLGRELSARWAAAGWVNEVDVAGWCGWIAKSPAAPGTGDITGTDELTEPEVDRAAAMARGVGIEPRDRVGSVFQAENNLDALRGRMVHEYKSRFATAIVFGLPALALHYLGPVLSGGGEPRSMVYPWLFELILVGWACVAAGWPILWQGALSLIHFRATADLFTTLIVLVAFIPSALGLLSTAWSPRPWFIATAPGGGPMFHAAMLTITLAVWQRWLAHRAAARLSGRGMLMLNGFGRLIALWMIVSLAVTILGGWGAGLGMAMVMPPLLSLGAINRRSPGWSLVLPVFAFAAVLLLGPRALRRDIHGVEAEIAAGFQLMMALVMAAGWRGWARGTPRP